VCCEVGFPQGKVHPGSPNVGGLGSKAFLRPGERASTLNCLHSGELSLRRSRRPNVAENSVANGSLGGTRIGGGRGSCAHILARIKGLFQEKKYGVKGAVSTTSG